MAQEEVGALWAKKSKTGLEFMSGVLKIGGTAIEVVAFKNEKKKNERGPDWRILRSQPKEQAPMSVDDTEKGEMPSASEEINPEDIPF